MTKRRLKSPRAQGGKYIKPPDTGSSQGSTNLAHPVFCLQYLGNLDDCETAEQAALAQVQRRLAQMTWQEIMNAPRHGLGCERIPVGKVRVPLPAFVREQELEFVLTFRLHGKTAMLAVRDGATLRILHLDRDFTAYDHG